MQPGVVDAKQPDPGAMDRRHPKAMPMHRSFLFPRQAFHIKIPPSVIWPFKPRSSVGNRSHGAYRFREDPKVNRMEIEASDDAGAVLHAGEAFLTRAPVEHNMAFTILQERSAHPEPGRYWMVSVDGRLSGLALQSPPTVPAVLTEIPQDCIEELANAMAGDRPDLPGIFGEADTVTRFAGCWAERMRISVAPVEALRLYCLTTLRPPASTPGSLRTAGDADLDLVIEWLKGFRRDTGGTVASADAARRRLEAGLISIWDDGEPMSMAWTTTPLARTVRVCFVYTPPEHRGQGYAASCVAAVSQAAFDAGVLYCALYTQLSNPRSNAIYRRLGYEPVVENLHYRFG